MSHALFQAFRRRAARHCFLVMICTGALFPTIVRADDALPPAPSKASCAWAEMQLGWTYPVTGHDLFEQGLAASGRLAYFPQPRRPFALTIGVDYSISETRSGRKRQWLRGLAGARIVTGMSERIILVADLLVGIDYIGPDFAPGLAVVGSIGPRVVTTRLIWGAGLDVIFSRVWSYDTEGGNLADPSGTTMRLGVTFGARW